MIEIHTGAWCEALAHGDQAAAQAEWQRIREGAKSRTISASKSMPATASTTPAPRRSRPCRRWSNSISATSWSAKRCSTDLDEVVEIDARSDGPRPRESARRHDHRPRLRHRRRAADQGRCIERHGDRFLDRSSRRTERAKAERRARRVETYAKRFAAKEACAKALGTGLRAGVFWRDMGVVNLPCGRPTMQLTGGALKRLQAITPQGLRGAHRRDAHRRRADRPGPCHYFRRAGTRSRIGTAGSSDT